MDGEVELGRRGEAAVNSDGIYREPKQKKIEIQLLKSRNNNLTMKEQQSVIH